MKKIVFILMLVFPFVAPAQFDDIYFVPKKEKKTVLETETVYVDDTEEYVDEEEYYTDGEYEYYDEEDYPYSTRIVRFRSPGRLVGSNLYWDLRYNCGINDWIVYDDGYTLDIYPAYNNYLYWSYTPYNRWRYDSYYNWNNYYWGYSHYYPSYHWNNHYYRPYGGCRPPYIAHSLSRPQHKVQTDVPVNGSLRRNGTVSTNGARRENTGAVSTDRGKNTVQGNSVGVVNSRNVRGNIVSGSSSGNGVRSSAVRPQSTQRGSAVNGAINRQDNSNAQQVRRQQTNRSVGVNANGSENTNVGQRRDPSSNMRTNRQSSPNSGSDESRGGYHSSDNSSNREYNRPSSTSVTRQRSYSSGSRPVSGFSGGGGNFRGGSAVRSGSRR